MSGPDELLAEIDAEIKHWDVDDAALIIVVSPAFLYRCRTRVAANAALAAPEPVAAIAKRATASSTAASSQEGVGRGGDGPADVARWRLGRMGPPSRGAAVMDQDANGNWVRYDDYAALAARCGELQELLKDAQCPSAYQQTLHADKSRRGECKWCNARKAALASQAEGETK